MSRIIDAGPTFRLRALMRQLYALLPREGADEMAEEAFRYAKWNWEKTNNRILPHAAWPGLRLASTAALIEIVKQQASGRHNPEPAWTGTEKQINWAKAIRAEAEPQILDWIAGVNNRNTRLTQSASVATPGVREARAEVRRESIALHAGLRIYDARFWIDARNCPDRATFVRMVEAYTSTRANPGDYRVMPYASAHRWEALAKAKGVSAVARSERGFMRMYERAGTWDNVNAYWRKRRAGFIARHMAQASSEQLWKRDKSGKLRPSRRALALIMWAYMPPGGPR